MGKKILKSNRHKKLKAVDPFYTGDRKLLLDKGLIFANQAPKNDDDKIPSKLRECFELNKRLDEQRSKIHSIKKTIEKKNKKVKGKKKLAKIADNQVFSRMPDEKGAEVPLRKAKKFQKLTDETEVSFLNRIEREAQTVIHRSQYENQFDVKIETDGEKVVVKKEKKMSERKRRSLDKHKKGLKMKKDNRKIENENKGFKPAENIKFGDIVHRPPEFSVFPKKKPVTGRQCLTIPANVKTKSGVTERDRNEVIQRYRLMKTQGKFNDK